MAIDREIGGIRCTEVLARLSDYVDGTADADLRARIEAHVAGCSWCEAFGGAFGATVAQIRAQVSGTDAPEAARERLLRRLATP